ncbi:MAG TPA: hypothetical protein VEA99_19270, partial [Gemmatimonadaceae bacterium]|nr:hypothetical protein [Gemmatimonadaceae bacterium]
MIARPSWGARLGVGVTRDAVRAVLVRGGRVRWHGETPVASDEGLADAIVRLVAQAPRARLVRPRLAVVLGPSLAQLKPLAGLPPVADARLLARVVREGASRFFLVPARGLVVPDARRRSDGAVWGAALDAEAVDEVQRAAERLGLALRCIAPAVAALGHATTAASLEWRDGPHRLRLTHAGGVPSLVERLPASTDEPPAPPAVPALARLGADAWRWADAWAATTVDPRGAHVWHPALDDMR